MFDHGDDDFHVGVAAASHNPFLVAAVRDARRLQRQSSAIGMHGTVGGHAEEAVEEHAAIYQAIRTATPRPRRRRPPSTSTRRSRTTGARSSAACSADPRAGSASARRSDALANPPDGKRRTSSPRCPVSHTT